MSTPIISPRPRTSPTSFSFDGQSAIRFIMWLPTVTEFSNTIFFFNYIQGCQRGGDTDWIAAKR